MESKFYKNGNKSVYSNEYYNLVINYGTDVHVNLDINGNNSDYISNPNVITQQLVTDLVRTTKKMNDLMEAIKALAIDYSISEDNLQSLMEYVYDSQQESKKI